MTQAIIDHYRCPERFAAFNVSDALSGPPGFFRFGPDLICYGSTDFGPLSPSPTGWLPDAREHVRVAGEQITLPFDPTEVVDNLRHERYLSRVPQYRSYLKKLYYSLRPALPTRVRRQTQRLYFHGWQNITFPRWPLDVTVERLLEKLLHIAMEVRGIKRIPFIWFWPSGAQSAIIMTHDVETESGLAFCQQLMDIDDSFGVQSSFEFVPEQRYAISPAFLEGVRSRGHEIVVHDLNHDGQLFDSRREFLRRVKSINAYGRHFCAKGFRAAMLYRNADWIQDLEFDYDMSVPNVGHLEAQRGGCCTIFPYFLGSVLELPVTIVQDYSLFHILSQYTMDIWNIQLATISQHHGLANLITHPDYLQEQQSQVAYRELLTKLTQCQTKDGAWITTPLRVNAWWRQRSEMAVVHENGEWRITGAGAERAHLAFIHADGGQLD